MFSSSKVVTGLIAIVALGALISLGSVLRSGPSAEQDAKEAPSSSVPSSEGTERQPDDGLLVVNLLDLYPEGRPSIETFAGDGRVEVGLEEIENISDEVMKIRPRMLELFRADKLIEPLWILPDGTVIVTSSYPQDEGARLAGTLAEGTSLNIEHRQVAFGIGELEAEMTEISELLEAEFAKNPDNQGVISWSVNQFDGKIWVETLEGYGAGVASVLDGVDREKVMIVEDPDGSRARTLSN